MSLLKSLFASCSILLVVFSVMAVGLVCAALLAIWLLTPITPTTPTLAKNPQPTDILHISGKIPAGISLQVVAQYSTTNPKCEVAVNWLEDAGDYRPRFVEIDVPVRQQENVYNVDVALDLFQKGNCGWAPASLYFLPYSHEEGARLIDPKLDAQNSNLGVPLIYFLRPRIAGGELPLEYGSGWTSFSVVCHEYIDPWGNQQIVAHSSPLAVRYFPVANSTRELQIDFVQKTQ
jgi:hypothetical protein